MKKSPQRLGVAKVDLGLWLLEGKAVTMTAVGIMIKLISSNERVIFA